MKEIAERIEEVRVVVGADGFGALLPAGLLARSDEKSGTGVESPRRFENRRRRELKFFSTYSSLVILRARRGAARSFRAAKPVVVVTWRWKRKIESVDVVGGSGAAASRDRAGGEASLEWPTAARGAIRSIGRVLLAALRLVGRFCVLLGVFRVAHRSAAHFSTLGDPLRRGRDVHNRGAVLYRCDDASEDGLCAH
jgi:hypothetical protein